MNLGMQIVSGFLFGTGMILSAAAMKFLFHFSMC